jgi:hypothetical protein
MLEFWKKFYLNGLGEFMVVNGLSPKEVAKFKVQQLLPPSGTSPDREENCVESTY